MDGSRKKKKYIFASKGQKCLSVGFTYINSHNNNNNHHFKVGKFSHGEDYYKVIYKN